MAFASRCSSAGRSVLSRLLYGQQQQQQQLLVQPSSFWARLMSTGQSCKLFVGGLSWQTDESQLRDAFSSFGEVMDAKIVMDQETGRSKGFGFISYASTNDADAAMKTMDGRDLNGRTLRVNFAIDKPRSYGGGSSGGYSDSSFRDSYAPSNDNYGSRDSSFGSGGRPDSFGGGSFGNNSFGNDSAGKDSFGNNSYFGNDGGYGDDAFGKDR